MVRRRYATHFTIALLIPALKGRAKFRGRYAAQKHVESGVLPAANDVSLLRGPKTYVIMRLAGASMPARLSIHNFNLQKKQ
jgi:hypothetical protein